MPAGADVGTFLLELSGPKLLMVSSSSLLFSRGNVARGGGLQLQLVNCVHLLEVKEPVKGCGVVLHGRSFYFGFGASCCPLPCFPCCCCTALPAPLAAAAAASWPC